MNEQINIAQQTEEVFGLILGLGFLLFAVGWLWPSISMFFSKYFVKSHQCDECGKILYPCKVCGCAYDDPKGAVNCAEWDKIVKHNCYLHHSHDEHLVSNLGAEEQWIEQHPEVYQEYSGKAVAIKVPDGIVASGNNFFELWALMKEQNISLSKTLFVKFD